MNEKVTAPVLTVWQPWASAIIFAGKGFENRYSPTPYRGLVFVQAAATKKAMGDVRHRLSRNPADNVGTRISEGMERYGLDPDCPLRVILGTVEIYGVKTADPSQWFTGPAGWMLRNPRPCTPIPWKGSQGFKYRQLETLDVEYLEVVR